MKRFVHSGFSLSIVIVLVAFSFAPPNPRPTEAASLHTPFGGQVESYTAESGAACVQPICAPLNETVRGAVRVFAQPFVAAAAAVAGSFTFGLGALAVQAGFEAALRSIDVCSVEEIKVGPPSSVSLGILNIGKISIPILGEINIGDILNLPVLTPEIYSYGRHKTPGVYVLGDSLNLLEACKLSGEGAGGGLPSICSAPLVGQVIDVLGEAREREEEVAKSDALVAGKTQAEAEKAGKAAGLDYVTSCPFLNLVHRIGSN